MLWYDSKARERAQRIAGWEADAAAKAPAKAPAPTRLPHKYAVELQQNIIGDVVLPGDPDYNTDRMLSNPRFSSFPQVIVYCEAESDVAECLKVAREVGLAVVVRSGGHSTGGFSSNDGFLIDVSRLNDVCVDPRGLAAWAGPGTNFRKFNAKIESYGLHTPGGACPDVCVGGYMQGGGYGFTARIFGMNCDQVEAVRVMLADGRIVYADRDWNRDLYWAVRGGTGSNFGVLLGAKYKLHRGDQFSGFSVVWSMDTDAGARQAAEAISWLQANFMRDGAPDRLGYQMIWVFEGPEGQPRTPLLLMRGMYRGESSELKTILGPVLALPGATLQTLYEPTTYSTLNADLLSKPYEVPEFPPNTEPYPPAEAKTSRYIEELVSADGWLELIRYFLSSPNPYTTVAMEIYGGGIEAKPALENAFIHRNVYCDVFFDVFWLEDSDRDEMLAYSRGWGEKIAPFWNGRIYQNYPSPHDPAFGENYWGSLYPAMRAIKTKYDPDNLFRYPQSIELLPVGEPGTPVDGLDDEIRFETGT